MLVNLLVLPLMVGIIQSLLQMILTVQYSSSAGMVVVFMMLVVSSYYGSRYLPHGYAMITRFSVVMERMRCLSGLDYYI